MKRSEMIIKLCNCLGRNGLPWDEVEDISKDLLFTIEAEGMLPPATIINTEEEFSYKTEWEPENEV